MLSRLLCTDGLNSWEGGDNCETIYMWEVVTSPGLTPKAYSTSTINPCTACDPITGACNGIIADITDLPGEGCGRLVCSEATIILASRRGAC